MNISREAKHVNPLFWVGIGFAIISYFLIIRGQPLSIELQYAYLGFIVLLLMLAFWTRERRLLSIEEVKEIAFKASEIMQNRGEIKESGRLIKIEDGVIREINGKPDRTDVAIFVDSQEPVFLVYSVHPYTGYIMRVTKRDYWSAIKSPDLRYILTPSVIEQLQLTRRFVSDGDM